jgi:flagellar motor switch protein FliM
LSIAENFAQVATIDFTKRLRVSTTVAFETIRLVPCDDYLARLPNPTCVAQVTFDPLSAPCLIHLDLGICFALLKKLMGGRPDAESGVRGFTEIERGLFVAQVDRLAAEFARACSKLAVITPSVNHLENNPNYLTGLPQGEALVCFQYEVALETVRGRLEVVLPLPGFRPVRDIFDPEQANENREPAEVREDRAKILAAICDTSHELVVKLAEMPVSFGRVAALKPGDLLALPQGVTTPLTVEIAGQKVYRCEAGRVGSQRAVRLTERLNEE